MFDNISSIHRVFKIIRNYLKCFDRQSSLISEVVPITNNARIEISMLSEFRFLTPGSCVFR